MGLQLVLDGDRLAPWVVFVLVVLLNRDRNSGWGRDRRWRSSLRNLGLLVLPVKDVLVRGVRRVDLETPLPCLFTVVKEINTPRIPSLKGMMRAKSAKIAKWTAEDIKAEPKSLGLDGSPTRVVKIFTPPARKGGEMLSGDTADIARELVELLKDVVI